MLGTFPKEQDENLEGGVGSSMYLIIQNSINRHLLMPCTGVGDVLCTEYTSLGSGILTRLHY